MLCVWLPVLSSLPGRTSLGHCVDSSATQRIAVGIRPPNGHRPTLNMHCQGISHGRLASQSLGQRRSVLALVVVVVVVVVVASVDIVTLAFATDPMAKIISCDNPLKSAPRLGWEEPFICGPTGTDLPELGRTKTSSRRPRLPRENGLPFTMVTPATKHDSTCRHYRPPRGQHSLFDSSIGLWCCVHFRWLSERMLRRDHLRMHSTTKGPQNDRDRRGDLVPALLASPPTLTPCKPNLRRLGPKRAASPHGHLRAHKSQNRPVHTKQNCSSEHRKFLGSIVLYRRPFQQPLDVSRSHGLLHVCLTVMHPVVELQWGQSGHRWDESVGSLRMRQSLSHPGPLHKSPRLKFLSQRSRSS